MGSLKAAAAMLTRLLICGALAAANVVVLAAPQQCSFSDDCSKVDECVGVQDAACVCNFGSCVIDGNPFTRGLECTDFTDCSCSDDAASCFCRNGFCIREAWECHTESDCQNLDKCKNLDCRCSDSDLCEPYDCYEDLDCGHLDCYSNSGCTYSCKNNTCDVLPLDIPTYPGQCFTTDDCRYVDFCYEQADSNCVCEANYCIVNGNSPPDIPDFLPIENATCLFTKNCADVSYCKDLADASCVCKFGTCVTDGGYFFRDSPPECIDYNECACSENPASCFCRDGFCRMETWECHTSDDCLKLDKCHGRDCRCSESDLCEPFDCYEDIDCINGNFDCNSYGPDYICSCESNTCKGILLPPPTLNMRDNEIPCNYTADCATVDYCTNLADASCVCEIGFCQVQGDYLPDISNYENATCSFSRDCSEVDYCTNLADAACVCKFGVCVVDGGYFFRDSPPECLDFKECYCSDNPDTCFCRDGYCKEEAWECHTPDDCSKLDKCQGEAPCRCSSSDLCEPYECYNDQDCFDGEYDCADSYPGFTCSCDSNACTIVDESHFDFTPPPSPPLATCSLDEDCTGVDYCLNLADASCFCNDGRCEVDGGYLPDLTGDGSIGSPPF